MIWAILALLGVPLWLCAAGITIIVFRNRGLRKRHGDIPVRVKRPGKTRWTRGHWTRGHGLWVSDVFAWRGSPAAWSEDIRTAVTAARGPSLIARQVSIRAAGPDLSCSPEAQPSGALATT